VIAIDPGSSESAYVIYENGRLAEFGKVENATLLARLPYHRAVVDELAIEMIASYGMPVGREVFETCVWIGRFIEAWSGPFSFVYRRDVKLHLCGQARAKDANIRQALIDKFGGKSAAIGTKASPGPLRGVKADAWQALAVAVTFSETCATEAPTASWNVSI
jgi:hypothetical protein